MAASKRNSSKKRDEYDAELEGFLNSDFNFKIYEDLTNGDSAGVFDPLEFFKILYSQIEFVKEQKDKPLSVMTALKRLKLTDVQRYNLYYYLGELIDEKFSKDAQVKICRSLIQKEISSLEELLYGEDESDQDTDDHETPYQIARNRFDFSKVRQHLESLPDTTSKIKYLVEIKTEYEQQDNGLHYSWDGPNFGKQCELEIKKLKELTSLDRPSKQLVKNPDEPSTRNPAFTMARQALALKYLLEFAKIPSAVNTTEIARFMSFVTGKNEKNIYDLIGAGYFSNKTHAKNKEDLRFVRGYFEKLGLSEIVKMINNDIDNKA